MKLNRLIVASLKRTLLLVGILSSLVSYAQSIKDYVVLTNGDVVSGKITEMNDSAVHVTSSIFGDFIIKKSDVQSITLNTTDSPVTSVGLRPPRPNYKMPLWYKTLGVSFNSLGGNMEIGRRIESTRLNTFIKSGVQFLPNYGISTIPVEIGFGLYHDTTKKSDFVQLHGGYSFLLVHDNWNNWYEPGMVYGFDYRHLFVSRVNPSRGTYIEFGYEGGVLKRDITNWWGGSTEAERVVHRNRFRFGLGIYF